MFWVNQIGSDFSASGSGRAGGRGLSTRIQKLKADGGSEPSAPKAPYSKPYLVVHGYF